MGDRAHRFLPGVLRWVFGRDTGDFALNFKKVGNSLDAAWKVFSKFIYPETADLPAETLQLQVSPIIIVFTAATGCPMTLAINLNINLFWI